MNIATLIQIFFEIVKLWFERDAEKRKQKQTAIKDLYDIQSTYDKDLRDYNLTIQKNVFDENIKQENLGHLNDRQFAQNNSALFLV